MNNQEKYTIPLGKTQGYIGFFAGFCGKNTA
jgi:hypothetical protein